jgi:hypothetical protein
MASIVDNPAGRLVTFRVVSPVDDANAGRAAADLRRTIGAIGGTVVVCTDLTDARVFAPEVTEAFVKAMKADNPKIERSAILLSGRSAIFLLQLERMIREAANPARRSFRDLHELGGWLAPVLSPGERTALWAFLSEARLD